MDSRTRREKLLDMAERGTEPEREIAHAKLAAMDGRLPPPPPPTRNAAPAPQEWGGNIWFTGNSGATFVSSHISNVVVTIRFNMGFEDQT